MYVNVAVLYPGCGGMLKVGELPNNVSYILRAIELAHCSLAVLAATVVAALLILKPARVT